MRLLSWLARVVGMSKKAGWVETPEGWETYSFTGTYEADLKYDDRFWSGAAPIIPRDGEIFKFTAATSWATEDGLRQEGLRQTEIGGTSSEEKA